MPDFSKFNRDQLAEALRKDNPDLAKELGLAEADAPPAPAPAPAPASTSTTTEGALTKADLDRALAEQAQTFEQKLAEKDTLLEQRAEEIVTERDEARRLAKAAHSMIAKSGLKEGWQADLKRRWDVFPSGPSAALLHVMESTPDGGSVDDALKEAVEADLKHAGELIAEANGDRRPRVRGLGGDTALKEGERKTGRAPERSAFRDFLRESGDKFGDKPEDFEAGLREMVQEGVR